MKRLLPVLVMTTGLAIASSAPAADAANWWRNLGWLEGSWVGQESGLPGTGQGRRCYQQIMDSRFLYMRSETRFPPQTRNPDDQRHAQWQIFSRDLDDQRILLRSFGSGGQVVTFVLDTQASRSDRLVFESAAFDQAPHAAQGRLTLFLGRDDSFRERLELGAAADALEQVMEGRWRRSEMSSHGCAPDAMNF